MARPTREYLGRTSHHVSSCGLLVDFHTSTVGTPGEQGEIDMLSGVDVFGWTRLRLFGSDWSGGVLNKYHQHNFEVRLPAVIPVCCRSTGCPGTGMMKTDVVVIARNYGQ